MDPSNRRVSFSTPPATPTRTSTNPSLQGSTAFQRLFLRGIKSPIRARLDVSSKEEQDIDFARRKARAYEYLCHLEEAKNWIERCLETPMPSVTEFEEALRSGVYLAKLALFFDPAAKFHIFDPDHEILKKRGLNFKYTDNVTKFIEAMKNIHFPATYHPEVSDVYESKNMPRVIYCIHALSIFLNRRGVAPKIENLVGVAEFTEEELTKMERKIDEAGYSLPKFNNIVLPDSTSADQGLLSPSHELESPVFDEKGTPLSPIPPSPLTPKEWFFTWPFQWEEWEPVVRETETEESLILKKPMWLTRKSEEEKAREKRELQAKKFDEDEAFESICSSFPSIMAALPALREEVDAKEDVQFELETTQDEQDELFKTLKHQLYWDHLAWGTPRHAHVLWPFNESPFRDDAKKLDEEEQQCLQMLNSVLMERRLALYELQQMDKCDFLNLVAEGDRGSGPASKLQKTKNSSLSRSFEDINAVTSVPVEGAKSSRSSKGAALGLDDLISSCFPNLAEKMSMSDAELASDLDASLAGFQDDDMIGSSSSLSLSLDDPTMDRDLVELSDAERNAFTMIEGDEWDDMWWGVDLGSERRYMEQLKDELAGRIPLQVPFRDRRPASGSSRGNSLVDSLSQESKLETRITNLEIKMTALFESKIESSMNMQLSEEVLQLKAAIDAERGSISHEELLALESQLAELIKSEEVSVSSDVKSNNVSVNTGPRAGFDLSLLDEIEKELLSLQQDYFQLYQKNAATSSRRASKLRSTLLLDVRVSNLLFALDELRGIAPPILVTIDEPHTETDLSLPDRTDPALLAGSSPANSKTSTPSPSASKRPQRSTKSSPFSLHRNPYSSRFAKYTNLSQLANPLSSPSMRATPDQVSEFSPSSSSNERDLHGALSRRRESQFNPFHPKLQGMNTFVDLDEVDPFSEYQSSSKDNNSNNKEPDPRGGSVERRVNESFSRRRDSEFNPFHPKQRRSLLQVDINPFEEEADDS